MSQIAQNKNYAGYKCSAVNETHMCQSCVCERACARVCVCMCVLVDMRTTELPIDLHEQSQ